MKKKLSYILFFLFIYTYNFAQNAKLTVQVNNVLANAGSIRIAVHNSQNHLSTTYVTTRETPASNSQINTTFELPIGTYSVAISQDWNNNGKLDKNSLGIPQEPYGFSNNVRPKFRAPTFSESQFDLPTNGKNINITLQKW